MIDFIVSNIIISLMVVCVGVVVEVLRGSILRMRFFVNIMLDVLSVVIVVWCFVMGILRLMVGCFVKRMFGGGCSSFFFCL